MILIGQYDSPVVRRVGVALTLYGKASEQRPGATPDGLGQLRCPVEQTDAE